MKHANKKITCTFVGGVTVLALALVPALARAQDGGFGIKGGYSYGGVSSSGALPGSVTDRSGFAIGVGMTTGGLFGLGVEGLYAQRGVTSAVPGDARRLDYIDVPVTLRMTLPTPVVSPFAFAGPQASYELQCGSNTGTCPASGRPRLTYAGVIGAGARLRPLGVSLEGRYIYGLTDLKLGTVSTSSSYKSRSFMILLGVGF